MTTESESRMREALEGLLAAAECAHAEYRYVRLVGTHHKEPSEIERKLGAWIQSAREALSPPARRTEYEWKVGAYEYRVRGATGGISAPWIAEWRYPGVKWTRRGVSANGLAAAIATLAGLTKPEEES